MLERASSCLESGGQQLLRKARRCAKSRRMLHSKFWHHAAGDLGLPVPWASVALSRTSNLMEDRSSRRTNKQAQDGGSFEQGTMALDFLYPTKTLAFIQHISNLGWDATNRKHYSTTRGIRRFSSNSGKIQEFTGLEVDPNLAEEKEELRRLLQNSNPLQTLQEILQSPDKSRRERVVWRLYEQINESDRTVSLRADLLHYLASSKQSVDAYRLIQIFESLTKEDRRASSYRAAISAYLRLNMVGTAIQVHDEAADRTPGPNFGSDILLARTIQDNQWDLAFRVLKTFILYQQHNVKEIKAQASLNLWSRVLEVPDLLERAISLLQYAQQYAHDIKLSRKRGRSFDLFARAFFPVVVEKALRADDPDDKFIHSLFIRLQELDLSQPEYYALVIHRMLKHPKYRNYTNQTKTHLRIYSMFRQEYLDKSETGQRPFLPPGKPLIRALIEHLSEFYSYENRTTWMVTVDSLVSDLRHFHTDTDTKLNAYNLKFIMAMYARAGKADQVYRYFDELRSTRYGPRKEYLPVTLGAMWPLLLVHARRVEVSAALEQFRRISDEFGLKPDTRCWNILLQAYARADDLDGILNCFDDFLASGLPAEAHSFGPVLNFCAKRGDVESVENLFSKAQSHNVDLAKSEYARGQLVLAHINNGDIPRAEQAAELMLKDKSKGELHGSLTPTWNYLITAYARQQDIPSTMRIYNQYQHHKIPLNSYTYAALMQSLILMRQTNAAYKILNTTMPNNNIQAHGFHYSLVVAGFVNEGQLYRAEQVLNQMERKHVRHSPSSRIASLKLKALTELENLKESKATHNLPRLREVEENLRQALLEGDASERALKQPSFGLHQLPLNQAAPDGYFEFLVFTYGANGAYEMCKEMFDTAAMYRQDSSEGFEAPFGLLTVLMEGHHNAKEYAEVDKCWELAKSQVAKMMKVPSGTQGPLATDAPAPDTAAPDAQTPKAEALKIAQNRRHLLVRATRLYFRDLVSRSGGANIHKLRQVVSSLLDEGYIIDNLTWNEYIQYLARTGHMIDAFAACEAYLMPNFVGWRFAAPHYTRKDPMAYLRMDLRPRDTRKDTIMPRYKTLVIMAAALGHVRREEEMGLRSEIQQTCSLATLQKIAPKTVRAIETMPVLLEEPLQRRYLMGLNAL